MGEENAVFIDKSVGGGNIPEDLTDQQIRRGVREEYLSDSTGTIVLVGNETKVRKHVDWEIYSSMHDGMVNKKSGILNIYHRDVSRNEWIQEDSHDSYDDGSPNAKNISRDTSRTDNVMASRCSYYWGECGPQIPSTFLSSKDYDIRTPRRGHKNSFPKPFIDEFSSWIESNYESNRYFGRPLDWD